MSRGNSFRFQKCRLRGISLKIRKHTTSTYSLRVFVSYFDFMLKPFISCFLLNKKTVELEIVVMTKVVSRFPTNTVTRGTMKGTDAAMRQRDFKLKLEIR